MMILAVLTLFASLDGPEPIPVVVPARDKPVSYARELAEVLGAKCVGCHNSGLAEGKLVMEEVADLLKGGKRGPSVLPGKSEESLLFRMGAHRVEPVMPPAGKKDQPRLTSEELGLLKLWIDAGARDDSMEQPAPAPIVLGKLPGGMEPIVAVDLSPDSKWVAAGRGNRVVIYEVATGRELVALGGHQDVIQSIRFHPGGRRLAAGSHEFVTVWDLPTDLAQPVGEPKKFGPHAFRVLAIDFSPDGKLMATGGGEPARSGEVKLWDLATGNLVRSLDGLHSDTVFSLKFSPDGSKLATASADRFVKVIRVEDGKDLKSFEGHTHHVLAVDWSSDGKQLVSGGADHVLKVWDFETGEQLRTLAPANQQVTAVRWVPNQSVVAGASGDSAVRLWNPTGNGNIIRTILSPKDYFFALAVSTDGRLVVAGGSEGTLYFWNGENGHLIRKLEPAGQRVGETPGSGR